MGNIQFFCQGNSMHGTPAAKSHQGKLPGIMSLVGRDEPQGITHIGIGNAYNATGQFLLTHTQFTFQR